VYVEPSIADAFTGQQGTIFLHLSPPQLVHTHSPHYPH